MLYSDLTVLIGAPTPDGYPVTVRGPGGDARGLLISPTADPIFSGLAVRLARYDLVEAETAILGQMLFRALFVGQLKAIYDRSLGQLAPGQGLRLKLDIDAREQAIAALPWEFLHDPDAGALALSETPIVRYLDLPQRIQPLRRRGAC